MCVFYSDGNRYIAGDVSVNHTDGVGQSQTKINEWYNATCCIACFCRGIFLVAWRRGRALILKREGFRS